MPAHYSDRCQKVLDLAADAARSLNRPCIGTEHLLLALMAESDGAAAAMLERGGASLLEARAVVVRLVPREANPPRVESPPWSPTAQEVLDLTEAVAQSRGHFFVGNQHLLLALLQQRETVAWRVLEALHVDLDALRTELQALLASNPHQIDELIAS